MKYAITLPPDVDRCDALMDSAYSQRNLLTGERCPYRWRVITRDGRKVCRVHGSGEIPEAFRKAFES